MQRKLVVAMASIGMLLGLVGITSAVSQGRSSQQPPPTYLVALGDSYAEGYQPGFVADDPTLHGFNDRVVQLVASRHRLHLMNFGCGGATSESMLHEIGCVAPAQNAPSYAMTTQAASAASFMRSHRGHIGLVTISIGFNDFTHCVEQMSDVSCVEAALPSLKTNLKSLVTLLRSAAGPEVPMIGTSYPDVALATWVATPRREDLARQSLSASHTLINPTLAAAYASGDVSFVNVTEATGAFIPLSTMTTLAPFGTIPQAVANVCRLTWKCAIGDSHPNAAGYGAIAKLVAARYLQLAP